MSWIFKSKNSSDLVFNEKNQTFGYITTDAPDYIMVGQNEDEFLIWFDNSGSFLVKNTGS